MTPNVTDFFCVLMFLRANVIFTIGTLARLSSSQTISILRDRSLRFHHEIFYLFQKPS